MELRKNFVLEAMEPAANISSVCLEYEVSRKTGYKWLDRYKKGGVKALADLSRRPHRIPKATDGETVLKVIELHHTFPKWGPKKLRVRLMVTQKGEVPTVKTIARILKRAGEPLIRPQRKRRKEQPIALAPKVEAKEANALWTIDFKGWWRTRDRKRCEPLTVRDAFSRFMLCAQALTTTTNDEIKPIFIRLFETYGLPEAILVDNGPPFSSRAALHGLTRLSAWWVSLGIRVVRSRPGCPQDNGGHERMHADIRSEVELFPAEDIFAQQIALDRWQHEFNDIRPHEALAMKVPADVYKRSKTRYRGLRQPCYPIGFLLRRVDVGGHIRLDGSILFIAGGIAGFDVGIESLSDGTRVVWFYQLQLLKLTLVNERWVRSLANAAVQQTAPSTEI